MSDLEVGVIIQPLQLSEAVDNMSDMELGVVLQEGQFAEAVEKMSDMEVWAIFQPFRLEKAVDNMSDLEVGVIIQQGHLAEAVGEVSDMEVEGHNSAGAALRVVGEASVWRYGSSKRAISQKYWKIHLTWRQESSSKRASWQKLWTICSAGPCASPFLSLRLTDPRFMQWPAQKTVLCEVRQLSQLVAEHFKTVLQKLRRTPVNKTLLLMHLVPMTTVEKSIVTCSALSRRLCNS